MPPKTRRFTASEAADLILADSGSEDELSDSDDDFLIDNELNDNVDENSDEEYDQPQVSVSVSVSNKRKRQQVTQTSASPSQSQNDVCTLQIICMSFVNTIYSILFDL